MDFKNKNFLVIGMARSGRSAAALLLRLGAAVSIYDSKKLDNFAGELDGLLAKGVKAYLGTDAPVEQMDCLVLSPGVPMTNELIVRAKKKGIPMMSEIELGFLTATADIVAISGTNGKTTTTALTGAIFENSGAKTYVLGNIGVPISEKSADTLPEDVIVAETAALQLETTIKFHPRACALLNVTEDHMDRYGTMENYTNAKAKMFDNQTTHDYAVLNYDNDITRALKPRIRAKLYWFSTKTVLENGAFLQDGRIIFKKDGVTTDICGVKEVRIPGMHNVENALAATALASVMGIGPEVIAETLRTFPGVEHRIEFVREVNGISTIPRGPTRTRQSRQSTP